MNIIIPILLTIIGTVCAAGGQICLKIASPRMSISKEGTIKNYPFLLGLFLYGLSMVLNIVALKWAQLSILNPIASLNYVWAVFLSKKFLGEQMNTYKWLGIIVIIIGVILIVQ